MERPSLHTARAHAHNFSHTVMAVAWVATLAHTFTHTHAFTAQHRSSTRPQHHSGNIGTCVFDMQCGVSCAAVC